MTTAAPALSGDQRRALGEIADVKLAEEAAICHRQQEFEKAQAAAAERHANLTAEAKAAAAESFQAIKRCEADFDAVIKSLQRIHEVRNRERRVRLELGEVAVHLGDEAIGRRMSLYIAQKMRAASLPKATVARYGALNLPPLFRVAPSWVEAEQQIMREPENHEESDHAE